MSTDFAVLFNFDSHQISDMYSSERKRILEMITQDTGKTAAHTYLEGNHRCDPAITKWADLIVQMKYIATCGKADEYENASLSVPDTKNASTDATSNGQQIPTRWLWLNKVTEKISLLFNWKSEEHLIITHSGWVQ